MYLKTKALVVRETNYKDADKILTVITDTDGKLTVKARGARRKSCRYAASCQLLAYSEMVLFSSAGRWTINEAEAMEQFIPLREDLLLLSLGSYFAEVLETLSTEGMADEPLLRLTLNSLYALGLKKWDSAAVKAAFEMRAMSLSGYAPALDGCILCGAPQPKDPCFSLSGVLHCMSCSPGSHEKSLPLCADSLTALRYLVSADAKKIYSFSLGAEAMKRLSDVCEAFLLAQTDRRYGTLDFVHGL